MIKEAIVKIVNKEDLTYDEAYSVMNETLHFLQLCQPKVPEQKQPMKLPDVRPL